MTSPEPLAAHGGARPPLRDIDLPYDAAAALADLAERADAHEVLHLVREHGPALMVMTEDDFDQAVEDAADLAEARAVLARMEPRTPEQVADRHEGFMTFLDGVKTQARAAVAAQVTDGA